MGGQDLIMGKLEQRPGAIFLRRVGGIRIRVLYRGAERARVRG